MFVLAIKHVKLVQYDKYFLFFSDSEKLENIAITQYCVKSVRSFFWSVFSCIRSEHGDLLSPNTGRCGPEKTPHLDTFYAVQSNNDYS